MIEQIAKYRQVIAIGALLLIALVLMVTGRELEAAEVLLRLAIV